MVYFKNLVELPYIFKYLSTCFCRNPASLAVDLEVSEYCIFILVLVKVLCRLEIVLPMNV